MPVIVIDIPIAWPLFSAKYELSAKKNDDIAIPIPSAEIFFENFVNEIIERKV